MKWVGIGLAGLAAIAGLAAVVYWYRSSKIQIKPAWRTEPGEERLSQAGWITGTLQAQDLNFRMADHTGVGRTS
jgi:hypothetical protein